MLTRNEQLAQLEQDQSKAIRKVAQAESRLGLVKELRQKFDGSNSLLVEGEIPSSVWLTYLGSIADSTQKLLWLAKKEAYEADLALTKATASLQAERYNQWLVDGGSDIPHA